MATLPMHLNLNTGVDSLRSILKPITAPKSLVIVCIAYVCELMVIYINNLHQWYVSFTFLEICFDDGSLTGITSVIMALSIYWLELCWLIPSLG